MPHTCRGGGDLTVSCAGRGPRRRFSRLSMSTGVSSGCPTPLSNLRQQSCAGFSGKPKWLLEIALRPPIGTSQTGPGAPRTRLGETVHQPSGKHRDFGNRDRRAAHEPSHSPAFPQRGKPPANPAKSSASSRDSPHEFGGKQLRRPPCPAANVEDFPSREIVLSPWSKRIVIGRRDRRLEA